MRSKFYVMFFALFFLIMGMSFVLPTHTELIIPFVLICIAGPLAMIWFFQKGGNNGLQRTLLANGGIKTNATILKVEDTNITMNNVNFGVRLTVEVHPQGDSAFQAIIEVFVSRVQIPRAGDVIEVIYDPNDHTKVAALTS